MTNQTGSAAYLAALPPDIQDHLVALVKKSADTSENEKRVIMEWIEQGALGILLKMRFQEHARLAELLCDLGVLLGKLHTEAESKEVA